MKKYNKIKFLNDIKKLLFYKPIINDKSLNVYTKSFFIPLLIDAKSLFVLNLICICLFVYFFLFYFF